MSTIAAKDESPVAPLVLAAVLAAAATGALAGIQPLAAVGLVVGGALLVMPFVAPATHLTLLLVAATLVPVDVQNRVALPGGPVLVDVLLVTGVAAALPALLTRRLSPRAAVPLALVVLVLLAAVGQFLHGYAADHDPGVAGSELRSLLGLGVFIVALPLIGDDVARKRLFVALVVAGLLAGAWGNAQWILQIDNGFSQDIGVEQGVALTTEGVGRVTGGRYVFGTALILAFAALASGARPRSSTVTLALVGVVVLNATALLLTFERSFWLATVMAVLLVVLRAGRMQRVRAIVFGGTTVILVAAAMSALAPGQFSVARERLLSVGQYDKDTSVSYRVRESTFVVREIRKAKLTGSGLGAGIFWGRPAERVPPSFKTYSHNAYLWMAWKLGIPLSLLTLSLVAFVLLGSHRPLSGSLGGNLESGAAAALLAMLVIGVVAPVFSTLSSSAVIAVLLALAVGSRQETRDEPGAHAAD